MARNPPTCPAEKRSLGENLVNDRWIQCSAQVQQVQSGKGAQFHCLKFSLGSAGEPTICSHCYSVPYMKIPANNRVILLGNKLVDHSAVVGAQPVCAAPTTSSF